MKKVNEIVDDKAIRAMLNEARENASGSVDAILERALKKNGLALKDAAVLLTLEKHTLIDKVLKAAGKVKADIYGERLVLFAPLYISNFCINDCDYCGFRSRNKRARRRLTMEEVREETAAIIDMGHKRILLECGEEPEFNSIEYVLEAIENIYGTKSGNGEIRRVNVNIAPPGPAGFKRLKQAEIGTYQLFQETYDRFTYEKVHKGPKADFERQLTAHDMAFEAGIDDVGLGVLYGLYDHRFETLALISHAKYLEKNFGVGPHTVSVPRIKPAHGVNLNSEFSVDDDQLLLVIAVLRLALPYTGIIFSTREAPALRSRAFEVGVTQASASSAATPSGYKDDNDRQESISQFSLEDTRSVESFLQDALAQELLPSFCTACYRRGRTGEAFMELARPGDIQTLCRPNAILTFKEYLEDYASVEVKEGGLMIIKKYLPEIRDTELREETLRRIKKIEAGERDLYF